VKIVIAFHGRERKVADKDEGAGESPPMLGAHRALGARAQTKLGEEERKEGVSPAISPPYMGCIDRETSGFTRSRGTGGELENIDRRHSTGDGGVARGNWVSPRNEKGKVQGCRYTVTYGTWGKIDEHRLADDRKPDPTSLDWEWEKKTKITTSCLCDSGHCKGSKRKKPQVGGATTVITVVYEAPGAGTTTEKKKGALAGQGPNSEGKE